MSFEDGTGALTFEESDPSARVVPTFSDKLREIAKIAFQGRRLSFVEMRAVIHAAAEIERLTSQLEAVRLGKPVYHEPPYVDGYFGER